MSTFSEPISDKIKCIQGNCDIKKVNGIVGESSEIVSKMRLNSFKISFIYY